jgi:hypothetical protein
MGFGQTESVEMNGELGIADISVLELWTKEFRFQSRELWGRPRGLL